MDQTTALFLGILPLLVFVIIDSFLGLKAGLIAAIVLALAEAIFSLVKFGELDLVSGASFFLVLILGAIAWKQKSEKWFLFQPAILSVGIGLFLLISYYLFGRSLWHETFLKYENFLPQNVIANFRNPIFLVALKEFGWISGYCFILHGLATAWVAVKLSKWWWIAFRGIGFYFFLITGWLAAQYYAISLFK